MNKKCILLAVLTLNLAACCALAQSFEMDQLETDDLRLLYLDPVQTYLTPHVSRSFHTSLAFQRRIFDWQPWEKPTVVLMDLADYGNASAATAPVNNLRISIAPFNRTLETLPGAERTFMLMNHELVHIATTDAWNDKEAGWRKFFAGKPLPSDTHPESILYSYLAAPRMISPGWYKEGSAVFLETWMSGGVGRAQGAYDEMVFRAMVRDDAHFYSNLGLVSEGTRVDFQVGVNAYLYGTRFISYLAYEYSPAKLIEWLSRGEESERYYSRHFEKVFGLPMEDAWDNWIAFEHEFQNANLASVREHPLTPHRPVADQALGSISRAFLSPDESILIGAFRYPGVVAHVGMLNLETRELERVTDIKGPKLFPVTSAAYDPERNTLFYTADNSAYRDLMAVELSSGDVRMVLEDARIGDFAYNRADRSLWGLRHLNGYVSLVRIPFPYEDWNEIYTWPYGQEAYELDVSHDGALLSISKREIDGSNYLQVYETEQLLAASVTPKTQHDFGPSVPEGFVFSHGDRYLYGSSFITGVSNILRFEIATGELEAVSNAETGFFRPLPRKDGSLIVFEYTGQGFLPTEIDPVPLQDLSAITFLGTEVVKRHPELVDWSVVKSFREFDAEAISQTRSKYRPGGELELSSAYPVLEGYRDDTAFGWHFNFTDPAQFHRLQFTASYTVDSGAPADEALHVNLEYAALNWDLRYWHNDADFYDLFGPTEYSRKGDAFLIGYKRALIFDDPRELMLNVDLDYYTGLDTLPANQNVAAFQFTDILSAELGLGYSNTRKSLGAVDHEKGVAWDLVLSADRAEGETVTKARTGLDFGFALPWKHSSIWFYNAAGVSDGDRINPLTSYYFGGFGNNYVDDGDEKRYREPFSFPGFEIDTFGGKSFVKSVLEWNLPPIRFREVGSPGFFLSWIRPALFASHLRTDPRRSFKRRMNNAGVQFDLSFTIAHQLPMTLSVGYAEGRETGGESDYEWMLSLKVL